MKPTREQVMEAFCTKVFATPGFKTTGRRVVSWTQVTDQPALFVRKLGETSSRNGDAPGRVTLHLELWIYSKAGEDPSVVPDAALNDLLDAIDTALKPDNVLTNRLTLGGLVHHCWIEGETLLDPGDMDQQAKAIVPVFITVP